MRSPHMPFYLSMRASIRAKVTAARLEQASEAERPAIAQRARAYFDWALRFITPPAPVLVAVGGLSGTGKSALARALAPAIEPAPGAVLLRSDVERKALFGKAETEPLPSAAYTPTTTLRVYCTIADKARRAVAAGHSAIVDAVFATPQRARRHRAIGGGARRAVPRPVSGRRSRHPASPALEAAAATPPMPTPRSRARRRATSSARSAGHASMPRARRRRRSRGAKGALRRRHARAWTA